MLADTKQTNKPNTAINLDRFHSTCTVSDYNSLFTDISIQQVTVNLFHEECVES
jgi:hypothetical protein